MDECRTLFEAAISPDELETQLCSMMMELEMEQQMKLNEVTVPADHRRQADKDYRFTKRMKLSILNNIDCT